MVVKFYFIIFKFNSQLPIYYMFLLSLGKVLKKIFLKNYKYK